jgi:hypothetical protein
VLGSSVILSVLLTVVEGAAVVQVPVVGAAVVGAAVVGAAVVGAAVVIAAVVSASVVVAAVVLAAVVHAAVVLAPVLLVAVVLAPVVLALMFGGSKSCQKKFAEGILQEKFPLVCSATENIAVVATDARRPHWKYCVNIIL